MKVLVYRLHYHQGDHPTNSRNVDAQIIQTRKAQALRKILPIETGTITFPWKITGFKRKTVFYHSRKVWNLDIGGKLKNWSKACDTTNTWIIGFQMDSPCSIGSFTQATKKTSIHNPPLRHHNYTVRPKQHFYWPGEITWLLNCAPENTHHSSLHHWKSWPKSTIIAKRDSSHLIYCRTT